VRLFTPLHGTISGRDHGLMPVDFLQSIAVDLGRHSLTFSVWTSPNDEAKPAVYFIDCPQLFHRPSIYTGEDDEAPRFVLFSRAVLECCQRMGWGPDVFHCHDWHTALATCTKDFATLLTVHNLPYAGFGAEAAMAGFGKHRTFDPRVPDHLKGAPLALGLVAADHLSTVSEGYAHEILTAEHGAGFESLLRSRRHELTGILNGLDLTSWDPMRDAGFDADRPEGRARAAAAFESTRTAGGYEPSHETDAPRARVLRGVRRAALQRVGARCGAGRRREDHALEPRRPAYLRVERRRGDRAAHPRDPIAPRRRDRAAPGSRPVG